VPPRTVPSAALGADPGSVSDAVNRLLEAAQSGVYPTVAKGSPKASQTTRVNNAESPTPSRGLDAISTGSATNLDPASRAAAELAAMKAARSAAPDASDYYAGFKQVEKMDKATLAEQRKKDRARLRTVKKGGLPMWLLALVVAGGLVAYFFMNKPTPHVAKATVKVVDMLKNDDFDGARSNLVEKAKKTKLTATEQQQLYDAYLGLGKQQIEEGDYTSAVATLSNIPKKTARTPRYMQARELIKQYKGKPNKIKKSADTATSSSP